MATKIQPRVVAPPRAVTPQPIARSRTAQLYRIVRVILCVVVIAVPSIVTLGMLHFYLGYPLDKYTPMWVDEYVYWHEVYSFTHVGFNTGYYTFEELEAPASFTHFDPHGPLFPALMSVFAILFGWYYQSMSYINFVFITVGVAVFVIAIKPNIRQLLLTGALLATFYPLLLYMPNALEEVMYYAFACVIGVIVYLWFAKPEKLTTRVRWLFIAVIFAFAAFRMFWVLVYIPLLLLDPTVRRPRRFIGALALTGILCVASYAVYWAINSVRPEFFIDEFLRALNYDVNYAIQLFNEHLNYNIALSQQGHVLEVFLREQCVAFIALTTVLLVLHFIPALHRRMERLMTFREAAFHFLNVGLIFIVQLCFYDMRDWRDYRMLATHLFLSVLVLIAFKRYWLAALIIASAVLLPSSFLPLWGDYHDEKFFYDRQQITNFQQSIDGYIYYDDTTDNGWCNTVSILNWDTEYIGLPAGVGFNKFENGGYIGGPPRSRYLIMPPADYFLMRDRVHFKYVTETTLGTLYLNLDAACPPYHGQSQEDEPGIF